MADSTQIIVSLIGLAGISVNAVFSYLSSARAKEINDAVNHRHEKRGADAPKLYDLAWENHRKVDELVEWKRTYQGGPLDDGNKVVEFVDRTERRLSTIEGALDLE